MPIRSPKYHIGLALASQFRCVRIASSNVNRSVLLLLIPFLLLPPAAPAQKKKRNMDEDGLYPPVVLDNSKKKKTEPTQTLPAERELPAAVAGETDRLIFQVSPLSNKGLLTPQTREALRALQRSAHGATILKLRAFVAGSGDMRRIGQLVSELWSDKRTPLPVLSVVQTGGLPLEGAQVVIESIAEERKTVNPSGIVFLSGQPADGLEQSIAKLESAAKKGEVLRVTCFVRSLDENKHAERLISERFPNAAVNYVQSQRQYLPPSAECEGVARAPAGAATVAPAPKLVLSGAQLGFGTEEGDIRLAFERLQRALTPFEAQLKSIVDSHVYVLSRRMAERIHGSEPGLFESKANTTVQVEGLPSLDAAFGVDVIAAADYTRTVSADSVRTTDR